MLDFKERFKDNLMNKDLIKEDSRILLGVSGGPDSLTMLDLFDDLRDDLDIHLLVFHLNHCFRKEAEQEAAFVKKICDEKNIEVIIKKYDVSKYIKENNLSPEEGARKVRFKYLKKIYEKKDIDKVSLAHNKNDLVETILLNIFRGSGLRGLKGIEDSVKIKGMEIIHPILIFYRSEIIDYCNLNNLKPVFDKSNESNLYSRNRIRNNILPLIEEQINKNVKQSIVRLAENVKEDYDFLQDFSRKLLEKILVKKTESKYILDLNRLRKQHPALIKRIINNIILNLKGDIDNFYYKHYNDIIRFIGENSTGDLLDLPDGINLKISYDKLFVYKGLLSKKKDYKSIIDDEGVYELPYGQKISIKIEDKKLDWRNYKDNYYCLVDYRKIEFPLKIRNRKSGDKFIPLGMKGHKKVKDFFIDEKVPDHIRDQIPLLFDGNDNLIWVCGYRMDDRFKLDNLSKKTIIFKYQKEGNK